MEITSLDEREPARLTVSVIICTRDRGDALLPTVRSILADAPTDGAMDLLVVDQSDGDSVRQALAQVEDARLRYRRELSRGLSAARNAGIRATEGELIAFTDDDCVVEAGWLAALRAAFAAHPEAGLVFGAVIAADHDPTQGFLPCFEAREGLLTRRRMRAGAGHWGMGANMALRRSAVERIGAFDELLGAGARLRSAEDSDYVLRAVESGLGVHYASAASVTHYGFRPTREARRLLCDAARATGAVYAKHLRSGELFALKLLSYDVSGRLRNVVWHVFHRRRVTGLNALRYELIGFVRGWRLPYRLDGQARTPVFVAPPVALPALEERPLGAADAVKQDTHSLESSGSPQPVVSLVWRRSGDEPDDSLSHGLE